MCDIAGFCNLKTDYTREKEYLIQVLTQMHQVQSHRGADDQGYYLDTHVGLAHGNLWTTAASQQPQPFLYHDGGKTWAIVFDGELYDQHQLFSGFESPSDAEITLNSYMKYGCDFVKKLKGSFGFVIWDPYKNQLLLYRDRSGTKPLFYTLQEDQILFASELKGILCYPGRKAKIDSTGLNEIFSMGPAKTYGHGVFKDIYEVLPGHYLTFGTQGIRQTCYWKLESHLHEETYDTTVAHTTSLVLDAIQHQMTSDAPLCTLLSGGLDSSLVSAVCANQLAKKGKQLTTFSFDFTNNEHYFKASSFQPSLDRPYVDQMVRYLNSNHQYLECSTADQVQLLKQSVTAHDLPSMADVDSSLLYFCTKVKQTATVALTGECADEIFGGYPWFHKKECFDTLTFPWTMDLKPRQALLNHDFLKILNMENYVASRYEASIKETPTLEGESPLEARRREIAYLNQKWFMQTLLDRMDRSSMQSGLVARVPFADHRIIEYLWNVPWDMKTKDGVVKGLLRECGKNYLPENILYRKKSPYPKTYDTAYEASLQKLIQELLHDSSAPVLQFLDLKKVKTFLSSPSDYGKPWYGQLMAGPQMLAYIWQVNEWLKQYQIEVLVG